MNDREPPLKKMKKPSIKPTSFLSLHDDLLLSCLARVSRLYYPTISLVCKRFQSLLASPEFYKARSLIGCTESCLYVCLRLNPHSDPSWFTLYCKPNQTLTNDISEKKKYVLAPIPIPHYPHTSLNNVVAIGSTIYTIGGFVNKEPSSKVSILDCRSHIWREGPSMRMKRMIATANVLDGKIYVGGECDCNDYEYSSKWMEVFDPKTGTWELVLSTLEPEKLGIPITSKVIGGEIVFMLWDKGVAYKPKEDRWKVIKNVFMDLGLTYMSPSCVIDNVLYSHTRKTIKWYDSKTRYWYDVKGLESLPKLVASYDLVKLVDCGGKMVVLLEKLLPPYRGVYKEKLLSCAVITLERRNNREIWGNLEWFDSVLTVPKSYRFLCAVAATV